MYTIKKSKTQWIIKFKKPYLDRLLNAHPWVYPAFWSHLVARLQYLGAPKRIFIDYDQSLIFEQTFGSASFNFSLNQTKAADFFLRGLNSTMCGDIEEHLEVIEDFAAKYLSKECS